MGDPVHLPPVPNVQLTVPPLFAHRRIPGIHLLPDLQLNPPKNPNLPPSAILNPVSGNLDDGYSILSNSARSLLFQIEPPTSPNIPALSFPPVRLGGPLIGPGASYHIDLPFGLDYAPSPDISGKTFHQFSLWLNHDAATVGNLGIVHQFGFSNGFTDGSAGSTTQASGYMIGATLFNLTLGTKEQQKANTHTEIGFGQFTTNFGSGGLTQGRSYGIASQVEFHQNEQWSVILSGTVNFTPPDSNANGQTHFANAMFFITVGPTHFIIPNGN